MGEKTLIALCPYCWGRVTTIDDEPHESWNCPKCSEIETQDVEFEDDQEVEQ